MAIRAAMEAIPIWHEWRFQSISSIYVPVNNNNIKIILIIPSPKSSINNSEVVFSDRVSELAEKSVGT